MTHTREEIDAEKAHKPRPDLLPAHALMCAGRAMGYGYRKHGDCTWRVADTEQADPRTHIASAMRHLLEHLHDPDACEEGSGLPVLWHAAAQLLIAVECVEQRDDARVPDERPVDWEPAWRWAPEQTEPLPEGWRWVHDDAEGMLPWAACSPAGVLYWRRTPSSARRDAERRELHATSAPGSVGRGLGSKPRRAL